MLHPTSVACHNYNYVLVNKFTSFRHATITNLTGEPCAYYFSHSYLICYNCIVQISGSLICFSHTIFNCRVLKIYFRRTAWAYNKQRVFVVWGAFKNCMKTIQDKLSTQIPTIRTLRDSLVRCLNAATKEGCNTHTHMQCIFSQARFQNYCIRQKIQCDCDC